MNFHEVITVIQVDRESAKQIQMPHKFTQFNLNVYGEWRNAWVLIVIELVHNCFLKETLYFQYYKWILQINICICISGVEHKIELCVPILQIKFNPEIETICTKQTVGLKVFVRIACFTRELNTN